MASIHKRFKSPFWIAAFVGVDGRRKQISTKRRDRAAAMKLALEWSKAAKAGREGRLSESQCRKVLSEMHEQANGEPLQFYTVRAWLEEWLAGKDGVTAPRTFLKYQQIVNEFIAHVGGARADAQLAVLSQRDLRSFRDTLARAGHSHSTVNQTLKILRSPFNRAHQLGFITMNPTAGVELLRRDDADIERDVFTPQQVRELVQAAEGDWKGAILAAYFTGLRLCDVTELRWENVDLEGGLVRVKTIKTGSVVVIPIHSEFARWLRKQIRGIGKAPVFPSLAGKTGSGKSGLSMSFKRIMERAEIKGRILRQRKEGSAGRTQSSLSFHSMRHSFNSALANAGVAQEVRQKLTGHSDQAQNKRYTHHEIAVLRAAVDVLPSFTGKAR
jgi:integrase